MTWCQWTILNEKPVDQYSTYGQTTIIQIVKFSHHLLVTNPPTGGRFIREDKPYQVVTVLEVPSILWWGCISSILQKEKEKGEDLGPQPVP